MTTLQSTDLLPINAATRKDRVPFYDISKGWITSFQAYCIQAMNQDGTPCVKSLGKTCLTQCLQWPKVRSVHRSWMRNSFEKWPPRRPTRRWKDNIKIGFRKISIRT